MCLPCQGFGLAGCLRRLRAHEKHFRASVAFAVPIWQAERNAALAARHCAPIPTPYPNRHPFAPSPPDHVAFPHSNFILFKRKEKDKSLGPRWFWRALFGLCFALLLRGCAALGEVSCHSACAPTPHPHPNRHPFFPFTPRPRGRPSRHLHLFKRKEKDKSLGPRWCWRALLGLCFALLLRGCAALGEVPCHSACVRADTPPPPQPPPLCPLTPRPRGLPSRQLHFV